MLIMEPDGTLTHQPGARHARIGAWWAHLIRWLTGGTSIQPLQRGT